MIIYHVSGEKLIKVISNKKMKNLFQLPLSFIFGRYGSYNSKAISYGIYVCSEDDTITAPSEIIVSKEDVYANVFPWNTENKLDRDRYYLYYKNISILNRKFESFTKFPCYCDESNYRTFLKNKMKGKIV